MATKDGDIIDANLTLLNILGSPSIEATKAINVLKFPPLVKNSYADKFNQCVKEGNTIEFEMKYKSKWDKESSLHSFLVPLKDTEGNVSNVYTLIEDITERKRTEQIQKVLYNISNAANSSIVLPELIEIIRFELGKLIETTNFYIAFHDENTGMLTNSTVEFDEKDKIETWPAEKSATGYVIKHNKSLLASADDIKKLVDENEIELIGTPSDIWLGVPLKADNKVIGALVVQSYNNPNAFSEDDKLLLEFISNQIGSSIGRKKSEELLRKSEERFDLAMKASNDGLYDWNLITNEVYYSARWKSILGYTDDELPNNLSIWESLSHQEEKEQSLKQMKEKIAKKIEHYNVEFRMKHKLGQWVNILSRAQIIFNEEGKAIRAVGTHSDLTEEKAAEKNLKDAVSKAKESDRLKSAFLANMSHEIRTPMNGILGFTTLLKEPDLTSDEKDKYIKVIERSGKRMLTTINDIVDISKIEAELMNVEYSQVSINKQLEYLYIFFKPEAEKKGMKLSFKNGLPDTKDIIKSDIGKFNAILTNLIKNAIKYSHQGNIDFGYDLIKTKEGQALQFYVKDTGIGVPADRLHAIFDRFVQADIEDKQVYEGSGLGLTISKAYVEMLGGKIWIESVEGEGSQFYFTLPYQLASDRKKLETSADAKLVDIASKRKLNILIAEDDETSLIYLKTVIKNIAEEIIIAKTGIDAVEICKKKQNIDLILMDIKMPGMNGYEASKQIREFNKNVVIIAQTAYALAGDRELSIQCGCNDYISKPINKNSLLEIIWKHLD
jgi:PAS domain S-box-containing protein